MNRIEVEIISKLCETTTIFEFKVGELVKTLADPNSGDVFIRMSKTQESIEISEDGDKLAETILNPVNFLTDQIFYTADKEVRPLAFEERKIDLNYKISIAPHDTIFFFYIKEQKTNTTKQHILRDGSRWVKVNII